MRVRVVAQAPDAQPSKTLIVGPRSHAPLRGVRRVYGWTGVLMILAFLLSGAWTLALAVVQLEPSRVANALTDTAALDFGDFWTLQKADDTLAIPATALLVAIALGYFGLVIEMLRLSRSFTCRSPSRRRADTRQFHHRFEPTPVRIVPQDSRHSSLQPKAAPGTISPSGPVPRYRIWQWFRHHTIALLDSHNTLVFALPKLTLQTSILFKYLHEGFPQTTVFVYTSLLFLNWLISSYCAMTQLVDPQSSLVRIFYSFDLFFAVFAPIQAVLDAYIHFHFDSALFATRDETLSPGNFEAIARLFADPGEVSLFRAAFRSLQISTLWSLLVKIVLNVFTIRKWWQTIRLLSGATLGASVFIYSVVAVVSSTIACKHFDQCKVPSYRWNVGALDCSCSVFVERHTVVRTFAEWEDPIDTSVNLGRLAASGDLRVVQIVNRQLPTLPDELRRCTGLEQLILVYTKTVTIPEWANEFTNLEYFHIEGDVTDKQLQSLPRDMFANTPKLAFLHLGGLIRIPFVPDLDRVPQLKYLTLAILHEVTEFPSFDKLLRLERLNIVDAVKTSAFPSFHALHKLTSLVIAGSNAVCCNGFLTGACGTSNDSCQDDQGNPHFACTTQRISASDRAVVDAVGFPVCKDDQRQSLGVSPVTRESSDVACGGVMYKRCQLLGREGICVNTRWMAINCDIHGAYAIMRRLEIQRHVGDPCDLVVEAWLGCG